MRIIAGEFRGRTLMTRKGMNTRPTQDRVRESLFSILYSRLDEADVLDLFAGSGALALEAVSRGARCAVLVEQDRESISVIRRNIEALKVENRTSLLAMDYQKALRQLGEQGQRFTLAFLDPPYQAGLMQRALARALELLSPGGVAVCEQSKGDALISPDTGRIIDRRVYGQTQLTFVERITCYE